MRSLLVLLPLAVCSVLAAPDCSPYNDQFSNCSAVLTSSPGDPVTHCSPLQAHQLNYESCLCESWGVMTGCYQAFCRLNRGLGDSLALRDLHCDIVRLINTAGGIGNNTIPTGADVPGYTPSPTNPTEGPGQGQGQGGSGGQRGSATPTPTAAGQTPNGEESAAWMVRVPGWVAAGPFVSVIAVLGGALL
ncbi:hypothetical protein HDU85_005195 [Gaertneriomyces sp. JEL0708]|nr:hypothetical protein HDU85_005195 [Gaertneriomyces sp. JEL0708]